MKKLKTRLDEWRKLLGEVIVHWNRHGASTQSASLAFYTIFSLAPVLLVVIALAGAVFGQQAVRNQIFSEFRGLMGPEAALLIQEVLKSAARPGSGRIATVVGIATLLFGATAVFVQLQDGLNRVWGVAPRPGAVFTTLLRKRLLSFTVLLGIGFLLMVSLVLSAGLSSLGSRLEALLPLPVELLQVFNFVLSFVVTTLLFALIYRLLPDVRLGGRDVFLGAMVTSLLFVIGKTLIGYYLGRTGAASAYGAAGSLVVVLLWVYYSSLIFFFGAEFTYIHSREYRSHRPKPEEGAIRVPRELAGAAAPSPEALAAAEQRKASGGIVAVLGLAFLLLAAAPAWAGEKLRVEIEGLDGDLRRNVLATLSLEEARKDKDLTEERIRRLHARSEEDIKLALQPFGYYRPAIQSALEREEDTWVARYTVEAGPPLRVSTLDVRVEGEGADDPGFQQRVRDFPLKQGETVFHPDYEAGKQALVDYAAAGGYLNADFTTSEIRVDLDTYTSAVAVHFATGPRFHFGPVTFNQDFLNPDLLKGYVTFEQGEPLDVDKLLEMQTTLSDSPYFQRVEVVPRQDLAQGVEVPIVVNLVASARQRWNVGAGYGTDTGPRGTAAVELRRINRRGHRGRSEARLSQIEKSFSAAYEMPGAYPRTDVITFQVGYADLRPNDVRSQSALVGVGLTQARGSWREAYGLSFQREDFEVGVDEGTSELLIPQATWTRVRADDRISTNRGHRIEFTLRGADEAALSNASFLQGRAEGKLIHSFADRFRFITRLQVGQTETDQFRDLPPTVRFFAGGDQSVRGYGYQELGRRDEEGNIIGGESLLTGSVELEFRFLQKWRFLEKWGIAAFYDAGNAMQSLSGELAEGAGVGLRWVTPIGPIRADAAWALNEPGHPVRFHLTVGPDL